jgi:hypothetical protein
MDMLVCTYKTGRVDILRWAIENGCPEPVNDAQYIERKTILLSL